MACEPQIPRLPPITSSPSPHTPGRIVWIDLLTPDPEEARAFYGPLFDWTFEVGKDETTTTIFRGEKPVAGMISHDVDADRPAAVWLASLSVVDVDAATRGATSVLGRVLVKPQEAPDRGRLDVVIDAENTPIALLRSSTGDPPAAPARNGEILWMDLWTNDPTGAARFYRRVAGLEVTSIPGADGSPRRVLRRGRTITGGLVELPWPGVRANWLPYVRVADVPATANRARSLGGKVLLETPDVAILQDPRGGALGIQSRPDED